MSKRAELRRAERESKKAKTATYNLTKAQLDAMVKEAVADELQKAKEQATNDAINTAMRLLLIIPSRVMMNKFWPKSYPKRLPSFINEILEYYRMWQDGEIDLEEDEKDLWEYGGVRFEECE